MTYLLYTLGSFLLVLATLLPIINPLYATPVFWSMTAGATKEARKIIARKVAIYCFFILILSTLFGNLVLQLFGISLPIIQVSGGFIVIYSGWRLLHAEDPDSGQHEQLYDNFDIEKAKANTFYPLTFPLTCGPGTIAAAITVGVTLPTNFGMAQSFSVLGITLGCMTIGGIIYLANRSAVLLMAKISRTGMNVAMRLIAFILLSIGVQITWNGIYDLLLTLPFGAGARL